MKRIALTLMGLLLTASLSAKVAWEAELVPVLFQASQPAEVLWHGKVIGTTPCVYRLPAKAQQTFTFRANDCLPASVTLNLSDGRAQRVMQTMVADTCTLKVTSTPSGATVRLNGVTSGTTPLTLTRLPSGTHTLKVSLENYDTLDREVTLGQGVTESLDFALQRTPASLTVKVTPATATLFVDDELVTNGQTLRLTDGTYTITADASGCTSEERTVTLAPGDQKVVEIALASLPGTFEVTTTPAEVSVWLNNRKLGTTEPVKRFAFSSKPFSAELPAGTHTLTFKADGFTTLSRQVTITPQKTTSLSVTLEFRPDYELVLTNGQTVQGVLRKTNADNSVRMELKPGMFRTYRPEEIRSQRFLESAQ